MWNILKRPFCKHEYDFLMNIHGDGIIHHGWMRSIWQCRKCNKIHFHNRVNLDGYAITKTLNAIEKL
ncbi:hypothetical protein LC76P1_00118 [Lysinibacillus phage LC76P1]|nr:hypothetical protein LC76P1_00118 [Lysinibacillus phage LC76P1]